MLLADIAEKKETEKQTIEQVAAALGVSKTTVSRALSGKGRIGEATRARVFEYMGRTPEPPQKPQPEQQKPQEKREPQPARPAQPASTNNLALIIPKRFVEYDLPFLRKCMNGASTMAAQRGYDLLLCYSASTSSADASSSQLRRQLDSHKIDGALLSYAMADDPYIDLLRQYKIPFVLIGRNADETIPQVDNDQVAAAAEMTRLLLQLGARRIALLVGSGVYMVNMDRMRGYLRGLADFGVPVDQRLIRIGIENNDQLSDALEAALEQRADCLLCGDEETAGEVMQELRSRHINVPRDIRVASLYDSLSLTRMTPTVTAVQYDAERIGAIACRMLLDILAGKEVTMRIVEGYQVILRESTKEPPRL